MEKSKYYVFQSGNYTLGQSSPNNHIKNLVKNNSKPIEILN